MNAWVIYLAAYVIVFIGERIFFHSWIADIGMVVIGMLMIRAFVKNWLRHDITITEQNRIDNLKFYQNHILYLRDKLSRRPQDMDTMREIFDVEDKIRELSK